MEVRTPTFWSRFNDGPDCNYFILAPSLPRVLLDQPLLTWPAIPFTLDWLVLQLHTVWLAALPSVAANLRDLHGNRLLVHLDLRIAYLPDVPLGRKFYVSHHICSCLAICTRWKLRPLLSSNKMESRVVGRKRDSGWVSKSSIEASSMRILNNL